MYRVWACLLAALFLIAITGCLPEGVEPENRQNALPPEIEDWVNSSKEIFLGQSRYFAERFYVLATYGVKPTGGYAVKIVQIEEREDRLIVTVRFERPAEDAVVSEAITYPYDLAIIETKPLPVDFIALGAEEYVPTLVGFPGDGPWELPGIVAESEMVKVFNPVPGDKVTSIFKLEGMANVFEGTVIYRLRDGSGALITEGIMTGAMGDWGYYSTMVEIVDKLGNGELLKLELYTESAKDGSVQDLVEIELFFHQ